MNDLINKSTLRKDLSILPSQNGCIKKSDVMQILGAQKCAYVLNEVLEQLENLKMECEDPLQEYDPEYFVEKAIQIVKGGVTANAGDQATTPL